MLIKAPLQKIRSFPGAHYHARTYLQQHSSSKSIARDRLTQIIQRSIGCSGYDYQGTPLRVLSMPGVWWHFEKNLDRRFGSASADPSNGWPSRYVRFTGVEKSFEVYRAATIHMPFGEQGFRSVDGGSAVHNRNGYTLVNASVSEYLKRARKRFRVVWLDYFSPINKALLEDLKNLGPRLEPLGPVVVAINVMIGRETKSISEAMGSTNRNDFLANQVEILLGTDFKIGQTEFYKEEGAVCSRLQMAFVRS